MSEFDTQVRVDMVGRISVAPRMARTKRGVAVCQFELSTDPRLTSEPVVKTIFVIGDPGLEPSQDLPVRITEKLGIGCTLRVLGVEYQAKRRAQGALLPVTAIKGDEVRLLAWAPTG